MGMKLNDLKSSRNLSGRDLVLVCEQQPDGERRNSYSLEKSNFFQRTVRFIKYHVSGSYRKSVRAMRHDALRDLEKFAPIADIHAHGADGDGCVKDEIKGRLERLQTRDVNSWKFVKEVQSLAKFAEKEGTVCSSAKRNVWTGKSSSLSAGECQRYIQGEDWKTQFVKEMLNTPPTTGVEFRPNYVCGRAALECMTAVLLSDGVLQPPADYNNPEIIPGSDAPDAQSAAEKQERVSTAMAFLKFLTIEPHDKKDADLFKWSGFGNVSDADKEKFAVSAFLDMAEPESSTGVPKPFLEILTPEKALQRHVVSLLDKFAYKEGKGLVIDKRELRTMPQESEEALTTQQQKRIANKLLEFLS